MQAGNEVLGGDGYAGELFTISGKQVLTAGFREILEHLAIEENPLPEFTEGEEVYTALLTYHEYQID